MDFKMAARQQRIPWHFIDENESSTSRTYIAHGYSFLQCSIGLIPLLNLYNQLALTKFGRWGQYRLMSSINPEVKKIAKEFTTMRGRNSRIIDKG